MAIDKSKIKVGDKVKIRRYGMVSEDWAEVKSGLYGQRAAHDYSLEDNHVDVIAHQPNFKHLEEKVAAAEAALNEAKAELDRAKSSDPNNLKYAYGKRVYFKGFKGPIYGRVIPYESTFDSPDRYDKVWAYWEGPGRGWVHKYSVKEA